jgi:uncharacterized protein (DUF952 family)
LGHEIYHIATKQDWEARGEGAYIPAAFSQDGFIHCSRLTQVLGVANSYFQGRTGLLLLRVEPGRLKAVVRYEKPDGGHEHFPHVYGHLNLDAVTEVLDFAPGPDGRFELPAGLMA